MDKYIKKLEKKIKNEDNQIKFSFDYPEIEKSKIIVTNDVQYFLNVIKKNGAIPLFSPEYIEDIKGVGSEFEHNLYLAHIPLEK